MQKFHFKSITFYGVTIGLVLVLFKFVSAYGEANLKAPPTIGNRYRLTLADNLPNCEKSPDLILNIQQSGIYVNASLLPATSNTKPSGNNQHQNSLTGILNNQQINLSGHINTATLCQIVPTRNTSSDSTTMQMELRDPKTLTGQLNINGIPQSLKFTALSQTETEESHKSDAH